MTRADIETIINELAATTRYVQDSGRRTREAAEHIATASDQMNEVIKHIDAAVTAALTHWHGEDDGAE